MAAPNRPAPRGSALGVYSIRPQAAAAIDRIRSRIGRSVAAKSMAETQHDVAAKQQHAAAAQRDRGKRKKANATILDVRPVPTDIEDCMSRGPDRHTAASGICPWYEECGGCDLLGLTATEQEEHLTNRVQHALGELLVDVPFRYANTGKQLGYRHRARFHVQTANNDLDNTINIGFMERRARNVVDISRCAVLSEEVSAVYQQLYQFMQKHKPVGVSGFEVTALPVHGSDGKIEGLISLNPRASPPPDWPKLGQLILNECDTVCGVGVTLSKNSKEVRLVGKEFIKGQTPEQRREVAVALGGFVQGNLFGADTLIDHVLRLSQSSTDILELHGGSGLLSHALASSGAAVRMIELTASAVRAASLLPPPPNGTLRIETGNAHTGALRGAMHAADLIVVDPPRSGLEGFARHIKECGSDTVVAVFCDVTACARDLLVLSSSYDIQEVVAVNLFPQTSHVETVVALKRKPHCPPVDPSGRNEDAQKKLKSIARREARRTARREVHELNLSKKRHAKNEKG